MLNDTGSGKSIDKESCMKVLVCGEALVDLVPPSGGSGPSVPAPGGSPFNVAVGLSQLGVETGYLGKLSTDAYGRMLRARLAESGVDMRLSSETIRPTTTASIRLRAGEEPEYTFDINGTADRSLLESDLPTSLPAELQAVHFGSYSLVLEPGARALVSFMRTVSEEHVVSLDPNVRPLLIPNRSAYREAFRSWCSQVDLVKLSVTDMAFIAPGRDVARFARQILAEGPALVVVTCGAHGAVAFSRRHVTRTEAMPVEVTDTVGAGDAFMSGLLASLAEAQVLRKARLASVSRAIVTRALRFAARIAALTCQRTGADPPRRSEIPQPWTE